MKSVNTKQPQKKKLEAHSVTLHGEKCAQCNYTFRKNDELLQHITSTHNQFEEEILECVLCNKDFLIGSSQIFLHFTDKHPDVDENEWRDSLI